MRSGFYWEGAMAVAILARVSTAEQAERETIDIQTEFARKYVELHRLEIYDTYADDGISGTVPLKDRPGGARLLQDAKLRRFDRVLVYKLDRLGRSCRVILAAIDELEQHGIPVISMTEPFDTSNAFGRFVVTILAAVSEFERENILERTESGKRKRAENGLWAGGLKPHGYATDNGRLVVEPTSGNVIRWMFQHVAYENGTLVSAAKHLNALGAPCPGKSASWDFGTIYRLLTNTTYKGLYRYGVRGKRDVIEQPCPAIVSEECWSLAQQAMAENKRYNKRGAKREYLLTGLITCATCGSSYCGQPKKNGVGKEYTYYVCRRRTKAYSHPGERKCDNPSIRTEQLDGAVWSQVEGFLSNPGDVLEELRARYDQEERSLADMERERAEIGAALARKDDERDLVLSLYRSQRIDLKKLDAQFADIAAQELSLKERLAVLDERARSTDYVKEQISEAGSLLRQLSERLDATDLEQRRRLCRKLVSRIVIENHGGRPQARVHYRFECREDLREPLLGQVFPLQISRLLAA